MCAGLRGIIVIILTSEQLLFSFLIQHSMISDLRLNNVGYCDCFESTLIFVSVFARSPDLLPVVQVTYSMIALMLMYGGRF